MMKTTLRRILIFNPCGQQKGSNEGWGLFRTNNPAIGMDDKITFRMILESNGINDAIWCLRVLDDKYDKEIRLFACDCAERVVHLCTDERSAKAIEVSRRFANGTATKAELKATMASAWDAASDADAARAAAWAAEKQFQSDLFIEYFC